MIVYQDRLGTNAWRKLEIQKGDAFHAGSPRMSVRKRVVLRQFILKVIILPRQARDKYRENSPKTRVPAGADLTVDAAGFVSTVENAVCVLLLFHCNKTGFFGVFPMFVPSLSW